MKNIFKSFRSNQFFKIFREIKNIISRENYFDTKSLLTQKLKFYNKFVNPNDLVFDVGANLGNRIDPLLSIGAKIVAIEPQEQCCKILIKKFGDNIHLVSKGLGESEGFKDFYVAEYHTISSFSTEWISSVKKDRFKDFRWADPIKIEITTLDKLIDSYGLPKFIKIDVEGYELEVLKGLTHAIDIISFEYTTPEQVQKVIDCISQIEKYNSEIECNYSVGENMEFASTIWKTAFDFKKFIKTKDFISTGFGDVYVRSSLKKWIN